MSGDQMSAALHSNEKRSDSEAIWLALPFFGAGLYTFKHIFNPLPQFPIQPIGGEESMFVFDT